VIFFGQYTPLQGGPLLAAALARVDGADVTMIGRGQELDVTRAAADRAAHVRFVEWLALGDLQKAVADADVCLGIFGTAPKALRVVPNKVYQGAASAAAIVTSDTPPQRRALGDAAVFVPPGDADAIARALTELVGDRARVAELRERAYRRANDAFRPAAVVEPLVRVLGVRAS
jgi:glycosyltransferase involved in cell wall biosynthesis